MVEENIISRIKYTTYSFGLQHLQNGFFIHLQVTARGESTIFLRQTFVHFCLWNIIAYPRAVTQPWSKGSVCQGT